MAGWLGLSFCGVALGGRFFPRYFLQLLPPMALMAARGGILIWRQPASRAIACVAAAALVIPLVRFGPRYAELAKDLLLGREHGWADAALDRDSQAAATEVKRRQHPGDTLFVWGYRPGIFVYTRLPVASRFWDSQPLTGVPADRHLRDWLPVLPRQAARNRAEFAQSKPTFVVDSLSLVNPRLGLDAYPELHLWLAQYRVVARTPLSLIYELRVGQSEAAICGIQWKVTLVAASK
jgi:hypothetical protein